MRAQLVLPCGACTITPTPKFAVVTPEVVADRHASLTNGAATGESPIALMTRAGHSNMATTKRYLHLAGTVFRDEAERLEQRLLGGGSSTEPSTNLSAPEPTSADSAPHENAVAEPGNLA
jgi:hypothetical protein